MAKTENLDWLKKREEVDGKERKSPSKRGAKPTKKRRGERVGNASLRIAIHGLLIVLLIVLLSVAAHFILRATTRHNAERVVPEFVMTNIEQARFQAYRNDLNIIVNDSIFAPDLQGGTVLEQLPKSGTVVKPDRAVYVTISAMQKATVAMPYVAGRSLRQAKNMLDAASIRIKRLEYKPDIATNYVLSQNYDGREIKSTTKLMVPMGADVVLTVGMAEGADSVLVPKVLGLPLASARSLLLSSGLNVGMIRYDNEESRADIHNARVLYQGLDYGTQCRLGDIVSMSLSADPDAVSKAIKAHERQRIFQEQQRAERDSLEAAAKELGLSADVLLLKSEEEILDDDDLMELLKNSN